MIPAGASKFRTSPPAPTALMGSAPMIQQATSRAWIFCSVMTSPERTRLSPRPATGFPDSGFSFSTLDMAPKVGRKGKSPRRK